MEVPQSYIWRPTFEKIPIKEPSSTHSKLTVLSVLCQNGIFLIASTACRNGSKERPLAKNHQTRRAATGIDPHSCDSFVTNGKQLKHYKRNRELRILPSAVFSSLPQKNQQKRCVSCSLCLLLSLHLPRSATDEKIWSCLFIWSFVWDFLYHLMPSFVWQILRNWLSKHNQTTCQACLWFVPAEARCS